MMKNKELFTLNPDDNNLMNDGVVNINTSRDADGLKIIRHELKTFVCEGEYEKGIYRILDTYLKHIEEPKQPAVWVSGFFGSGKSHLIKIMGYLWDDYAFPNGDTARGMKPLPKDVHERLVELDRKQKIHGRLSISGTLKDFPASDIRYSFLKLLLNSLGLPQQYHHFKFIYWAKQEGILDSLKSLIEAQGKNFEKEVENLFVSSSLAKALLQLKPEFAENEGKVKEAFRAQFTRVESIDRKQLIGTIKEEILPMFYGDKVPCTIIVLDEVQQFIGQDGTKTIDIQNLAQDLCDHFNGKFLLVGSGQSALADTPQLSPLKDRFSVHVMLADTDVDTVTRKTVLEKKPAALAELNKRMEVSLGEISRNLEGTSFGYKTEDRQTLSADYPILPTTRKFWKKILSVIDTAGTSGQLRSQLRIVDESIKRVANKEIGIVIPADFVFEQKQRDLLQNALLLNETNNQIEERKALGGDSLLEGRILSMVFLIDLLPKDLAGSRLKSDATTIGNLLFDNLNEPSDQFRNKVKALVQKLVEEKVLMPVDDEFKLQTKVGAEWEKEFTSNVIKLQNAGEDQIHRLRKEKIIAHIRTKTNPINILQGISKQKREFELWDKMERPNTESKLNVWIRDGWNENESMVLNEIRAEGSDSPLAYIFVNKLRDQDLRSEIIKYIAAGLTLDAKGIPASPEGVQARKSMETRRDSSSTNFTEYIEGICKDAKVYLAGGSKIDSASLGENIKEALDSIADRQFFEFKNKADYKDWDKSLTQALERNPDALKRIQYNGETKDHPVSTNFLRFIGTQTKQGKEIRSHFMKAPYGWSQDAIDTILLMLRLTELISCSEPNLKVVTINSASFKKEIHILGTSEKMKLRKLYSDAKCGGKPGDEFVDSNSFIGILRDFANKISGDAPLPEPINTNFLKEIENLDGNERLLRVLEAQDDLRTKLTEWRKKADLVDSRMHNWDLIAGLYNYLPVQSDDIRKDCDAIREERLLFHEPDMVLPLLNRITAELNKSLKEAKTAYIVRYEEQMKALQANEYFQKLLQEDKHRILAKNQLLPPSEIKPAESQALLNLLQKTSLDTWQTKIAAISGQFQSALEEAILLSAPKAEMYCLPKGTLSSESEIDVYVDELKSELKGLLKKAGSIILK